MLNYSNELRKLSEWSGSRSNSLPYPNNIIRLMMSDNCRTIYTSLDYPSSMNIFDLDGGDVSLTSIFLR